MRLYAECRFISEFVLGNPNLSWVTTASVERSNGYENVNNYKALPSELTQLTWSRSIMRIVFEEQKIQSEPQMHDDKITRRPATPFPSPSLEGQQRLRGFLESQSLNVDTKGEDRAGLTEQSEYPKLTRGVDPDFPQSSTNV